MCSVRKGISAGWRKESQDMRLISLIVSFILLIPLANKCSSAAPTSCCVDVAFIVDSSGSIQDDNYKLEKKFVKSTASVLGVPSQSRGAVIIFGNDAHVSIAFADANTSHHFNSLVDKVRYLRQYTRIDKALSLAAVEVFPKARPGVAMVAIVITDGKQTKADDALSLTNASQPLRAMGVRVIAVGIGQAVIGNELQEMVENSRDVFRVPSFNSLLKKAPEIGHYICNITAACARPTTPNTKSPRWSCLARLRRSWSDEKDIGNVTSNNVVRSFVESIASLDAKAQQSLKKATTSLGHLLDKLSVTSVSGSDVMCCVLGMEEFSVRYARHHLNESLNAIDLETDKLVLQAHLVKKNSSENYMFPVKNISHGVTVSLPEENFMEGGISVSLLYKDLHHHLTKLQNANTANQTQSLRKLGTKIFSLSVKPKKDVLTHNVTLRFDTLPSIKPSLINNEVCVFWDFSQTSSQGASWSNEGCTVSLLGEGEIECSCNHLTHFAVLMQIGDEGISDTDEEILSIMTYIGLGISLLGCALTLVLYFAFVNVSDQLSQIRLNLVISIATGQIIFIAGIDATGNLAGCVIVAASIQYFYLVAFCWMLVEGVQLYLHIVKVFNIEQKMTSHYLFAWGFPAIVVAVTLGASLNTVEGARGFVHKNFCWLSFKNRFAWTFIGPVLAITIINLILLLHVIREISKMNNNTAGGVPNSQLDTARKTAKACVVLFPLLGVTWLFGVFTMSEVGVAAQYIFTFLNSIQGFLIFLLNCVRNSEIRSKFNAKFQLRRSKSPSNVLPNQVDTHSPCIQQQPMTTAKPNPTKSVPTQCNKLLTPVSS